jgi:hypothetical protein
MEKLFGAWQLVVSVLFTFERIEVRLHRSLKRGVRGGKPFIAFFSTLPLGAGFLHAEAYSPPQLRPNLP